MAANQSQSTGGMGQKMGDAGRQTTEQLHQTCGTQSGHCDASGIKEHMDVIASCGKKVGVVDHLEGNAVKLTKNDSPDGQHHFIPVDWVDHVDQHVHLKKNSKETEQGWKADAASCSCA